MARAPENILMISYERRKVVSSFKWKKKSVTLPLKNFKINIIENTEIKTTALPFIIFFASLREKQKINHGKFLVVPECLKIAVHQCILQCTKSNLLHSVSHAINALSLNYLLCDNFTFSLGNMFKRITRLQEFPWLQNDWI